MDRSQICMVGILIGIAPTSAQIGGSVRSLQAMADYTA